MAQASHTASPRVIVTRPEREAQTWADALHPGQPDATAYMTGRRSVALQISAALRQRPDTKETK